MYSGKFYFSKDGFKLIEDDTFDALKEFDDKSIDMIFADPPYFLSSGGITCSGGKMVSVNKGDWIKVYQQRKNMSLIENGFMNVIEF